MEYSLWNHTPRLRESSRDKVRRRLFQEPDWHEQARIDNYNNAVIEEQASEVEANRQKWSYDFENDVPIPNERWQWYTGEDGKVYGMDTLATGDEETVEAKDSEDGQAMKLQNETTPKNNKDEDDAALGTKRTSEDNELVAKDTVRRRISFD